MCGKNGRHSEMAAKPPPPNPCHEWLFICITPLFSCWPNRPKETMFRGTAGLGAAKQFGLRLHDWLLVIWTTKCKFGNFSDPMQIVVLVSGSQLKGVAPGLLLLGSMPYCAFRGAFLHILVVMRGYLSSSCRPFSSKQSGNSLTLSINKAESSDNCPFISAFHTL